MSEQGADRVGVIAARCLGIAAVILSLAALIYAVRWW